MLKVILIDDEQKAIKILKWEIDNFCKDVEIVNTFTDPLKAISFLKYNDIDCVFLDIKMPEMDGFKFLEHFSKRNFSVVFVTAYSEFALKAIKENALDYLLKPIDTDDLLETIEKIKAEKEKNKTFDTLEYRLREHSNKRIAIPTEGKLLFVNTEDINYCKSDGNYCRLHFLNQKSLFISKKLKDIQSLLPENDFYRIHNSYLINLNRVVEYQKTEGYVLLENEKLIPVSRSKKTDFLEKL